MPQLARRIGRAKPSAIMQVAEKAKRLKAEGRDIISFSIGVPNFLPAEHVYAAAREALAKDSGQYGSNRGSELPQQHPTLGYDIANNRLYATAAVLQAPVLDMGQPLAAPRASGGLMILVGVAFRTISFWPSPA